MLWHSTQLVVTKSCFLVLVGFLNSPVMNCWPEGGIGSSIPCGPVQGLSGGWTKDGEIDGFPIFYFIKMNFNIPLLSFYLQQKQWHRHERNTMRDTMIQTVVLHPVVFPCQLLWVKSCCSSSAHWKLIVQECNPYLPLSIQSLPGLGGTAPIFVSLTIGLLQSLINS